MAGAVLLWMVAGAAAASTATAQRPLEFVHALQDNGYGDVAVDYLAMLAQQPRLPRELRDVWDLEMAKSLQAAAAGAAFDSKESESLKQAAWKHLAKFIKEKPNHPETVAAMSSWADFLVRQAVDLTRAADAAKSSDVKQHEKCAADARRTLADAQQKYQAALSRFQAGLAQLPPPSKLPTKKAERADLTEARERAETNVRQAEIQLALIDYHAAQTYSDPKDAARIASLTKAAKSLDSLFQQNRSSRAGLYAHLWHGKVAAELGDLRKALDIFDEVLAGEPEPFDRSPATGLEPLFAEAECSRLKILASQKRQEWLAEATAWLRDYRRYRQTEGYQGIAADTARAMLAKAKKAAGPERAKLLGEALQIATDGLKVRSRFQQDLALLRQEILRLSGRGLDAGSFEEAVALGDAAAGDAQWQAASSAYQRAIELADKNRLNNPAAIAAVREARAHAQVAIARGLLNKRQWNECAAMVGEIVHDEQGNVRRQSAAAAQASALGVAAALNVYANASESEKAAALDRLLRAADLTEQNWPDRPEADDARMARGQAKLVAGEVRDAIAIFERVNPKSERYGAAMNLAGECYWRLFLSGAIAADDGSHPSRPSPTDRDSAIACLLRAIESIEKRPAGLATDSRGALDAKLLLAEIHYRGGQTREAARLYQSLLDAANAGRMDAADLRTARLYAGALRTYCALGSLDKAGKLSGVLLEKCPDTPLVNGALIEFARVLNIKRKESEASAIPTTTTLNVLEPTLVGVSQREKMSFGQMMFVGETFGELGMSAEASRQFQGILARTQIDAEFAAQAEKGMARLRTELLKVLRREEKFGEALRQVEQLIKDNPRALDPLMEKGRILEAWAEREPVRFREAAAHWAAIRVRLQGMKKKPPEYYEVMYHVAKCLVREGETSRDAAVRADSARKAEQMLKATLVLSPQLSGPDMVAQYNQLLVKAMALQGRQPNIGQKDGAK